MKDINGRDYLKLADAKDGQLVELDDGFTCHAPGNVTLYKKEHYVSGTVCWGLYFNCDEGEHYIDGQADDGINCVGIYPLEEK